MVIERHIIFYGDGLRFIREDFFELAVPGLNEVVQVERFAVQLNLCRIGNGAEHNSVECILDALKRICRNFHDECAGLRGKKQLCVFGSLLELEAELVAERHLRNGSSRAAFLDDVCGKNRAVRDFCEHVLVVYLQSFPVRELGFLVLRNRQQHGVVADGLERAGDRLAGLRHRHRKADKRRRDIEIFKGAGHTVLAANRRQTEVQLRGECAEQGCGRLAPALRLIVQALEVLLERQAGLHRICADSCELREALHNGVCCAVERREARNTRNIAVSHSGSVIGLTREQRNLRNHGVFRRQLILTGKRHQNGACADGSIETLGKALLAADLEAGEVLCERLVQRFVFKASRYGVAVVFRFIRCGDERVCVLRHTVRIEECTAQVDYAIAAPLHLKSRLFGDDGHDLRIEVFLLRLGAEFLHILRVEHDRHTLLRFGNRKLGAVEALVLLRDFVQINLKARCKLADGDAHAARAEVVAALDERGNLRVTEQTLNFAFGRRVALLHLCAANLDGFERMRLGGTRCAAAAVTARCAAEQHDNVSGLRLEALDVRLRRCADDRANLHALCNITGVIKLRDLTGRKADLVAVGGIARRSAGGNLSCGQLTLHRILKRNSRVAAAGNAHRLINIRSAGERVANRAAKACCRAAERLNLRRVVVGLILELHEPLLGLAVDRDRHFNGTGVDLVAFVQIVYHAVLFEVFRADDRHVHERNGLVLALIQLFAGCKILAECLFDGAAQLALFDLDVVETREECGVAAVVAPVGINHAQLRHARVTVLFVAEIIAAEREVFKRHGKAHGAVIFSKLLVAPGDHARDALNVCRHIDLHVKRLRLFHRCQTGFDRVHDVVLNLLHFLFGKVALNGDHFCISDLRALALRQELYALGSGIRTLVVLTGQKLRCEDVIFAADLVVFVVHVVHIRLGKDRAGCRLELLAGKTGNIIAVQNTQVLNSLEAEILTKIRHHVACFNIESLSFLHKYACDHVCDHSFLLGKNQDLYCRKKRHL